MNLRPVITGMLLLGTAACGTLSEKECRRADWNGIGLSDAQHGYAITRIADHEQACSKYQVIPDLAAYTSAHARGVTRYCLPSVGFQEGRKGRGYAKICPLDSGPPFVDAYSRGYDIYRIQNDIDEVDRRIFNAQDLAFSRYLTADQRSVYQSQLLTLYALRASLTDQSWKMESAYYQHKPAPAYSAASFP
jgi:hypothetical protein